MSFFKRLFSKKEKKPRLKSRIAKTAKPQTQSNHEDRPAQEDDKKKAVVKEEEPKESKAKKTSKTKLTIPLGHLLLRHHLITTDQLNEVLKVQNERRLTGTVISEDSFLGNIILELGFVAEEDMAKLLSVHCKVPFVELNHIRVKSELLELVPEKLARKYTIFPIDKIGKILVVGFYNPLDKTVVDKLQRMLDLKIRRSICMRKDILSNIDKWYSGEIEEINESELQSEVQNEVEKCRPEPDAPARNYDTEHSETVDAPMPLRKRSARASSVPQAPAPPQIPQAPAVQSITRLEKIGTSTVEVCSYGDVNASDDEHVLYARAISEDQFNQRLNVDITDYFTQWLEKHQPDDQPEAIACEEVIFKLHVGQRL